MMWGHMTVRADFTEVEQAYRSKQGDEVSVAVQMKERERLLWAHYVYIKAEAPWIEELIDENSFCCLMLKN